MAMSRSLLECGHDEDRDEEVCSYCASDGKLQPALYFCFDCGLYGKFICGSCLKQHNKFVNKHEVEKMSIQSTSRRTQFTDLKLKELQQSYDELQRDRNKVQKENETLLFELNKIKKENKKLYEELRDCKVGLDRTIKELDTKTDESEQNSKREHENRLIVKGRDNVNTGYQRLIPKPKTSQHLLVAAIWLDNAKTACGYSFTFKFKTDPLQVLLKNWTRNHIISQTAPTCVLIYPDGKTFHSFGYDAESFYTELAEDEQHGQWFFFKNFDVNSLGAQGIEHDIMMEDLTGKQLRARTVYALSIKYLTDDFKKFIRERYVKEIRDCDFRWVFIVPGFWCDLGRQFIIEAAEEAGIGRNLLSIVPDHVAAFMLCKHIPVENKSDGDSEAGKKYMVLDARDKTTHVTVLEVLKDGDLQELYVAYDEAMGLNNVNEAFELFLSEIFGAQVINTMKVSDLEDYIDTIRDFEVSKRTITPSRDVGITIRLPPSFAEITLAQSGKSMKECVTLSRFNTQVRLSGDKMRLNIDICTSFFDITLQCIYNHVKTILKEPIVSGCSTILMVGDFSECIILQEYIRKCFQDKEFIIPEQPDLAVLKGAVIFGHTI